MMARILKKIYFLRRKVPRHVDIEISTRCNLNCKMCKREKIGFGNKLMSMENFRKIIDKIPKGVEIISFGGYGEMLMNPDFFDMVKYAKGKKFLTQTTTNGTLLSNNSIVNKLFESGLDMLHISVEHIKAGEGKYVGHEHSDKVWRNIKRLCEVRKKNNYKTRLNINIVVHKENIDEIPKVIEYAEKLGVYGIELIRLDTFLNAAENKLSFKKEKELYENVKKIKRKISITTPADRKSSVLEKLLIKNKGDCPFRGKTAHINIEGEVKPCSCGFVKHSFGNIYKQELKEIWNSKKFRNIIKNSQNPVCRNCGMFRWP